MQVFWTVSLWFMTLCELIAPNLGLISNYALFSRLVPNKFAYQRSPGQLHCDLKSSSKLDKSKWDSAVHTHVAVVRTMVIPSSPTPRGMGMGSAVAATSSIDVSIQLVDPPKHLILRPLPPSLAHAHNRKSKFNFRCRIFHIVHTKTRLQVLFCASSVVAILSFASLWLPSC